MRSLRKLSVALSLGVAVALVSVPTTSFAAPTVDAVTLAPSGEGVQLTYGPVGQRIAAIAPKGSKQVAIIDGVEGPKVDQFVGAGGNSPFVFSDDGQHIAYVARIGQEVVIFSDGKEVARAKMNGGMNPIVYPPTYSPKGMHFFFATKDGQAEPVFTMDGKTLPLANGPVYFSADESTFAYPSIVTEPNGQQKQLLVVNGQSTDAPTLQNVAVTRDGKVLMISMEPDDSMQTITYDGKPVGKLAMAQTEFVLSASGGGWACFGRTVGADAKGVALVNGQAIEVDGYVQGVHFNSGGTKAAVHVVSPQHDHTVIVDGKHAGEYAGVDKIAFTADPARVVYVAGARNGKQFVVVGDEESDALAHAPSFFSVAPAGEMVAYAVGNPQNPRTHLVYINNKLAATVPALTSLTIAPNGKNWFGVSGQGEPILNGKVLPGVRAEKMVVSPDSKHIAVVGTDLKTGKPIAVVDGKIVPVTNTRIDVIFSSDGKHVFWMQPKYGANGRWEAESLMLDGVEVKAVERGGREQMGQDFPSEMANADGTFGALVQDGGEMKRLTIKPDDSTSLEKLGPGIGR